MLIKMLIILYYDNNYLSILCVVHVHVDVDFVFNFIIAYLLLIILPIIDVNILYDTV